MTVVVRNVKDRSDDGGEKDVDVNDVKNLNGMCMVVVVGRIMVLMMVENNKHNERERR